jgi:hypothetical protein
MRKGNILPRFKRIFLFIFTEKMMELLWYLFWIVLLIRQKSRLTRQPG